MACRLLAGHNNELSSQFERDAHAGLVRRANAQPVTEADLDALPSPVRQRYLRAVGVLGGPESAELSSSVPRSHPKRAALTLDAVCSGPDKFC